MKPILAVLVALSLMPMPLAAQTLTVLLPSISFPDGTLTPSTKGCDVAETVAPVCQLSE
jgi:hypothetical protein